MDTPDQTSNYFRTLQILYFALLTGQLLFALLSFGLHQMDSNPLTGKEVKDILLYMVPAVAWGGFLLSNIIFKRKLQDIRPVERLAEKLELYRSALISRYALLEAPSFLAIVAYLLTADFIFLGIAGIVIIYFVSIRPSKQKAIYDLELDANTL